MGKIKYILKKLKTMRYKEFYNKAKEIGNLVNKSTIYILFDMGCGFPFITMLTFHFLPHLSGCNESL